MKHYFERLMALVILVLFLPFFLIISLMIKINSKGKVLHWSNRVGKNNKNFMMPKFRTMFADTPQVATHLLDNPENYITKTGSFLRKSSLDEVPQLMSIFSGEMSFVGPRPALYNQKDLIDLRTEYNLCELNPGITGWAQINGRDELTIEEKVKYEIEYKNKQSINFDLYIIFLTLIKLFKKNGISH